MARTTPEGWSRICSSLVYDDPAKAIDFLCRAFGFEVQVRVEEEGKIVHSQLVVEGGLIMIGEGNPESKKWRKSPKNAGGNTQTLMMFVDDADAHCERSRKAGAKISKEPTTTDYGADYWTDRGYEAIDLEGHHWYFVQRVRDEKK